MRQCFHWRIIWTVSPHSCYFQLCHQDKAPSRWILGANLLLGSNPRIRIVLVPHRTVEIHHTCFKDVEAKQVSKLLISGAVNILSLGPPHHAYRRYGGNTHGYVLAVLLPMLPCITIAGFHNLIPPMRRFHQPCSIYRIDLNSRWTGSPPLFFQVDALRLETIWWSSWEPFNGDERVVRPFFELLAGRDSSDEGAYFNVASLPNQVPTFLDWLFAVCRVSLNTHFSEAGFCIPAFHKLRPQALCYNKGVSRIW